MNVLKTLILGGPVGLASLMDRERALHREHMAQLRAELDALQSRQISSSARAASFWKGLS